MEKVVNSIIELIKAHELDKSALIEHFKTARIYSTKEIKKAIKKLEETGIIKYNVERNIYNLVEANFFIGKIESRRDGKKYINHFGKKLYIKENLYLDNDLVKYNLDERGMTIDKIISRDDVRFVCEVKFEHGNLCLIPFSENIHFPFAVDSKELRYTADGDRILLDVSSEFEGGLYTASVNKVICNSRDMSANMKTLCEINGFATEFSEEAMGEARSFPNKVLQREIVGRKDQRKEQFFTIDGVDTKDRDDAISVELCDNGDFILRVNISHVSHYIRPGMALWNEALVERGNTVYVPGASNPQLPQILTNGICSLEEQVDRLTKTTEIRFDSTGKIIKYKIYNSVMNSRKAFTYDEVNEYFRTGNMPADVPYLSKNLDVCLTLSNLLSKIKREKGYISLNSDEIYFDIDKHGNTTDMRSYELGLGQEIIENFMVISNHVYNYDLNKRGLDALYRNHREPDYDLIAKTINRIKKLNILSVEDLKSTSNINEILKLVPSDINGYIISRLILRSLRKAYFSVDNEGHYGLALDMYAQSTSPIRRGNDLVNQYLQDLYSSGEEFNSEVLRAELVMYAAIFSEKERATDRIEYEADSIKAFEYFEKTGIKDMNLTVVDINDSFITVKKMGIPEGIIMLDESMLNYYYDINSGVLRERGTNYLIKIGNNISVRPSYVCNMGIVYEMTRRNNYKKHVKTRKSGKIA